jgi:hypothetical protein
VSAEAMGFVFRSSPYRGSTFAVHLAIADSVNDQNGNELWMSRESVATKARVSPRAAIYALKELVSDGFLSRTEREGRTNLYVFLFPERATRAKRAGGATAAPRGASSDETGVHEVHPNPRTSTQAKPKDLSLAEPATTKQALFVALCEATGRDPHGMTEGEARSTAIANESLWKAHATPEEVFERAQNYLTHYDAALTPHALVMHWSLCARPKRGKDGPGTDTFREAMRLREMEEASDAGQRSLGAGG